MTPATKNKIVYGVLIAAAIGLFLLGRGCGIKSVLKQTGTDTTINRDSVRIIYQPTPYRITHDSFIYVKGKPVPFTVHDTVVGSLEIRINPYDTAALIARIMQTSYYDTTVNLKSDTVRIRDAVSFNRIISRVIDIKSEDTLIKVTTVLKPPKSLVVYYTLSSGGNFNNPLHQQGVGFAIKLPSDKVYQVEIKRVGNHRPMIEATMMWPIKLGKR